MVRREDSRLSCSTAASEQRKRDVPSPAHRATDGGGGCDEEEDEQEGDEEEEEGPGDVCVAISELDLNGRGARPGDARLLVVCSKFETGYDDPRLGVLFIDRPLSGVHAYQAWLKGISQGAGCVMCANLV